MLAPDFGTVTIPGIESKSAAVMVDSNCMFSIDKVRTKQFLFWSTKVILLFCAVFLAAVLTYIYTLAVSMGYEYDS